MKGELNFLRVSESNIGELSPGISDLDFRVHKPKHNLAYWRWRYLNTPAGQSSLVVAVRGRRVVGRYGLLHISLMFKGKSVVVGLMSDLLIDPLEKSWQCYKGLVEKSIIESKKDNLSFRLGVAPYRVMQLNRQMDVVSLGNLPIYLGFLNISRILEGRHIRYPLSLAGLFIHPFFGLRIKKKMVSDVDIRSVESFDSNFDELWSAINKKNTVGVVKNAVYLNWRYAQCPDRRYWRLAAYRKSRLEGLVVFSATGLRRGGCVLELLVRDNDSTITKALLLRAFRTMNKEGIGCITASFPSRSTAAIILRKLGFHSWIKKLRPSQIIAAANSPGEPYPDFDLKNCSFSLGDWAVY